MEIQGKVNSFLDPYSTTASLDKSNESRLKTTADSTETSTSQGDTVTVSQDALLLTEARRTAQNAPDVRSEKVEALRTQVANGTYQIDSNRIAASLVQEEPGLFQS
jgi:negative regulator of flagellin synthesis FlgM